MNTTRFVGQRSCCHVRRGTVSIMGSGVRKLKTEDGEVAPRTSTGRSEYSELAEAMVQRQTQRAKAADEGDAAESPRLWQRIRKVVMVLCLAGCCLSWAPQMGGQAEVVPSALGADMSAMPRAQPVVRALWKLRIAFDAWRTRNGGALPKTLAVLPTRLRLAPMSNAAWIYKVDHDAGTYRIDAPNANDVGARAIWLDQRRGPPQVQQ